MYILLDIRLTSFVRNKIPSFVCNFVTIVIGYSSATSVKLLLPPAPVATISVFVYCYSREAGNSNRSGKGAQYTHTGYVQTLSKNVYVDQGTHWFSLYVVGRCLLADLEKHI